MTRRLTLSALALAAALSMPAFTSPTFAAPATAANKVLVIPFTTLNVPADQQWIGKAVQETLIADLGQTQDYSPIGFQGQTVVEDNATAARIARESATPFVVRGAAQLVNGDIRLTAQLIDAKTGDSVSTAIATGPANSLLKLEDNIAAQLHVAPAASTAQAQGQAQGQALATRLAAPTAPSPPAAMYSPPMYTPAVVYPPAPYNDISLAGQDYSTYSPYCYSAPVYEPDYYPTYSAPLYSGVVVGYGGPIFRSRGFPRSHFGGSFPAGGVHIGGGFSTGGGFHSGGGVHVGTSGGFHAGGGHR